MARTKQPPAEPAPLPEPEAARAPSCYGAEPIPVPELEGATDLFAQHRQRVEQTLLDATLGIRLALPVRKAKLSRGESEYEVETPAGETWWVYRQAPNTGLLRYVAQDLRGRPGTKETEARATTVLVQLAVPGHDDAVDDYLASLPPEALAKYDFPPETLARIQARRPK